MVREDESADDGHHQEQQQRHQPVGTPRDRGEGLVRREKDAYQASEGVRFLRRRRHGLWRRLDSRLFWAHAHYLLPFVVVVEGTASVLSVSCAAKYSPL